MKSVLGVYYSKIKEYSLANEYLLKVADTNYPYAFHNLGMNFYYGRGLNKDINKSKSLFEKSYKLTKSSKTALMLGKLALEEKKDEEALNFWLEALNNGNPNGAYLIGKYYMSSLRSIEDIEKVNRFLILAIEGGVLPAYFQLAKFKMIQSTFDKPELMKEAYQLAEKVKILDVRIANETIKMLDKIRDRTTEGHTENTEKK